MTSLDDSNTSSADAVLARARTAAGGAACTRVRTLRVDGTIAAGGLSGPFVKRIDRATRRSVRTFALGPAEVSSGFDGTRAWHRGPNGDVTLQGADAALRAAITQAWLGAHAWWSPDDATPFDWLGVRVADERAHDVLRARPAGGDAVELWFDRDTGLLARTVQAGLTGRDMVTRLDDHRDVDGVRLPFRTCTGNGDPRFDRVVTAQRIVLDEAIDAHELDAPAAAVDDVRFVGGGMQATVAVEVIQNTIVVPVTVDGHALRFVLDSGGPTVVLAEAADRLGLQVEGRFGATGMDGRVASGGFARVQRLAIGEAVVLERPLLHVLAMPAASQALGLPVDGILGAEVFRRLVLRLDYERATITFLRPSVEPGPDWGVRLPLTFLAHIPCVEATLDGRTANFLLDTGNGGAVLLHAQADAPRPANASAVTVVGSGVGGPIAGRFARGRRLVLGGLTLDAPVLRMLEDDNRAMAAPGLAGNIGAGVLSRFTATFACARSEVWLAPNSRLHAPFHADRSGLRIHAEGGRFEVVSVMAGSPADEAGLRVGDLVVAVDGVDATDIALHVQRRAWQESAAGTRVALRVARDGAAFEAALVLRNLIPDA